MGNSYIIVILVWLLTTDDQKNMFKTFVKHLDDSGILMFTTGSEAGEIWSDNGLH